ncbi:MAG: hypothetical protein WAV32_06905 [Halobacteriota archaeon]
MQVKLKPASCILYPAQETILLEESKDEAGEQHEKRSKNVKYRKTAAHGTFLVRMCTAANAFCFGRRANCHTIEVYKYMLSDKNRKSFY